MEQEPRALLDIDGYMVRYFPYMSNTDCIPSGINDTHPVSRTT
jgi:hypothetical protein